MGPGIPVDGRPLHPHLLRSLLLPEGPSARVQRRGGGVPVHKAPYEQRTRGGDAEGQGGAVLRGGPQSQQHFSQGERSTQEAIALQLKSTGEGNTLMKSGAR